MHGRVRGADPGKKLAEVMLQGAVNAAFLKLLVERCGVLA